MKRSYGFISFSIIFLMCLMIIFNAGCSGSSGSAGSTGDDSGQSNIQSYPIDSDVQTTAQRTIVLNTSFSGTISPSNLCQISSYDKYGYGKWSYGPGITPQQRTDLMPAGYSTASVTKRIKLLNFFSMTDIHITDKEAPNQLIYLQQATTQGANATSVYSPVMPYTTQLLDAAVQTVNALHKRNKFDFGISLGDVCNSTQYNELRWYMDVIDGKVVTPSSGAHLGADTIDYQKPFQAAGIDKSIPFYQAIGNHDHFFLGSLPVDATGLRDTYTSSTVFSSGNVFANPLNIYQHDYYMGLLNGSTPNADIMDAGPVASFSSAPQIVADLNRRSLLKNEWMNEFFTTTSNPPGHGFSVADVSNDFACYSFVPKTDIPLKVIVLDDTQIENDGSPDIHGHGFLTQDRWNWLKKELADGDAANQLMIIAAHIPIAVEPDGSELEWWINPQPGPDSPANATTISGLITELESHPNLLMWIAGHRHVNTVKGFVSTDSAHPEKGFWQIETSSLRDFPQQFRTFEIYLNSDNTISIVTTDVDPAIKDGTPASTSRKYAVAAQQIVANNLSPNVPNSDPFLPADTTDPTIVAMNPSVYSYNAELIKQLTPQMQIIMNNLKIKGQKRMQ